VLREVAESIWRYRAKIVIPDEIISLFQMIHDYLVSNAGQHILFAASPSDPTMNVPTALLQIVDQFLCLVGERPDICLAVYVNSAMDEMRYITVTEIQAVMQPLAAEIFGLDPVKCRYPRQVYCSLSPRGGLLRSPKMGILPV
jgi:hypothetical protein